MSKTKKAERLFDVVVYELESKKVERIVGKDMRHSIGHINAITRKATLLTRIDTENYGVEIVKANQYKEGNVLQ